MSSSVSNPDRPSLILADYAGEVRPLTGPLPANPTLGEVVSRRMAEVAMILAHGGQSMVIPNDPTERAKRVLNLGWLLRCKCIRHPMVGTGFSVHIWRYISGNRPLVGSDENGNTIFAGPIPTERFEPVLLANLSDGRTYGTQFADPSVLHGWLARPMFAGYSIDWQTYGETIHTTVNGPGYSAISDAITEQRARTARERELEQAQGERDLERVRLEREGAR